MTRFEWIILNADLDVKDKVKTLTFAAEGYILKGDNLGYLELKHEIKEIIRNAKTI